MRHRKTGKILSRSKAARSALVRDLATNLVLHEKIRTTEAKAKVVRPYIERLVTVAKAGTIAARRRAAQSLRTPAATKKIIETIAPRYRTRAGGYTRIVRIGQRQGDGATLVLIAFVEA
ncbi:MAG: 50S ribosomal protein L17 [Candidatus Kerfeldbacteria bacterium]|nr:50S ribosomal protein L17 [Candidatus Kerfeldbacteria bacterium]